eukprot:XP_014770718.1 PREDICTED: translocon-associated protein subunit beta-like [Octopus bimaculoides]
MMNSLSLLSVFLSFLCLFALTLGAEEEKVARLLASKNVMNQYLVEGKDVTVEYRIFNVGEALDNYPSKSNVTHAVVMKPLKFGFFNFTAAQLTYLPKDDAEERTIGYTSAPGEGGIINQKEFERRFSPHVVSLTALFAPFLLYFLRQSHSSSI